MDGPARTVNSVDDLVAAIHDEGTHRVVVDGVITEAPTLPLAPGKQLVGVDDAAGVTFAADVDGVRLSSDNEVTQLSLRVAPQRRAIFNDTSVADLGTLRLSEVSTVGQVQILVRDAVRAGHVVVDGLDVTSADVRDRDDRPQLMGVGVLQGAFTLWNLRPDHDVVVTADLRGISAGRDGAPVRGSGVFAGGADADGGRLDVSLLETGPVFTDGGIPEGTRDLISGGVFVITGCHVGDVRNRGPVTTFGVNDMALDNWGTVDRWVAEAPITTYGRSGVGFVNFGTTTLLRIVAPIERRTESVLAASTSIPAAASSRPSSSASRPAPTPPSVRR